MLCSQSYHPTVATNSTHATATDQYPPGELVFELSIALRVFSVIIDSLAEFMLLPMIDILALGIDSYLARQGVEANRGIRMMVACSQFYIYLPTPRANNLVQRVRAAVREAEGNLTLRQIEDRRSKVSVGGHKERS
jgi:hypothetical protein